MSGIKVFAVCRGWMVVLCLLASSAIPAHASSIFVREEFGFSFAPGISWTLEQSGPSVVFDPGEGPIFNLSYTNDQFLMTALVDNTVGIDSLPFGIDVYPSGVNPITPDFDCAFNDPCYNGFGFIAMFDFPHQAGEFVSLAIPPIASADEPATWLMLALGFGLLGKAIKQRRTAAII